MQMSRQPRSCHSGDSELSPLWVIWIKSTSARVGIGSVIILVAWEEPRASDPSLSAASESQSLSSCVGCALFAEKYAHFICDSSFFH